MSADRSPRVVDIAAAFAAIPKHGDRVSIGDVPAVWSDGHVQGLVRHQQHWIAATSAPSRDHGLLCVLDAGRRKFVALHHTPSDGLDHPGGMQLCGDFLFVAMQKYPRSDGRGKVLIYDLSRLPDGVLGGPVNQLVLDGFPAGAVGAVDLDDPTAPRGYRHLVVAHDNGRLQFWLSDGRPLPVASFTALPTTARLPDSASEQVTLVTDGTGEIYLISTEGHWEVVAWADKASLWHVPIRSSIVHRLTKVADTRHFKTVHGTIVGAAGVHMRYGGGAQVTQGGGLELYASQMHFIGGSPFALNVFVGAGPTPAPEPGGGSRPPRRRWPRLRSDRT